jgi:uncharacterized protein (DUF736 family)
MITKEQGMDYIRHSLSNPNITLKDIYTQLCKVQCVKYSIVTQWIFEVKKGK